MKDYAQKNYRLPACNGASRIITESFAAGLSVVAFVALILYDITGGLPA